MGQGKGEKWWKIETGQGGEVVGDWDKARGRSGGRLGQGKGEKW